MLSTQKHAVYMRQWKLTDKGKLSIQRTAEKIRENRPSDWWKKDKERRKKTCPEKLRARKAIDNRIQKGTLVRPTKCQRCGGSENIQAHHPDYSKPLEIEWVCSACHRSIHLTKPHPEGRAGKKVRQP